MTGRAIPWTVHLNRRRCKPGCRCGRKPIGRIGAAARRNRRAEAWPPIRLERRCRRRSLRPRARLRRCRPTPPIPPEPPFPPRARRRRRRFAAAASGRPPRTQPLRAPAQELIFRFMGNSFDRGSPIGGDHAASSATTREQGPHANEFLNVTNSSRMPARTVGVVAASACGRPRYCPPLPTLLVNASALKPSSGALNKRSCARASGSKIGHGRRASPSVTWAKMVRPTKRVTW